MRGFFNRGGRTYQGGWNDQDGVGGAPLAPAWFRPAISGIARVDGAQTPGTTGLILITPDEAGDGIGLAPGNPLLTIDAAARIGTLGIIGDQDFYQVNLVAGHSYEIGMFGHAGGPNLFPVQDSWLELYSAAGTLIASADGGASTLINNVNSGFDAVLNFTALTSGTYYVNARAFDNDPNVGGTTGEGIGDYELYVAEVDPNDPDVYHAYYDDSSPLYAIDWGVRVNKVNQSAANPDGDEGIRATGNAQGTPVFGDPVLISTLAAEQHVNVTGKNVITIYFAKAGDIFTSIEDPTSPGLPPATITATGVQGFEHDAVMTALGEFSKVADVVYLEVQDRGQADFVYTSYIGTPGPGVSLLGSMSPPDEPNEGLAQFNSGDERWNALNLQQGGFSFVTLIHEFGHGHGLAHPHDNGGHSGIMHGVESEGVVADYTLGDYDLNQSVFTMMSYEDGWQSSPYGNAETDVGYGYLGGLMAFDIAAIQDKYGVNEDTATGNDVYLLKDVNAAGTFYSSIWDGGGTDTIAYVGTRDANIDLRAATLQYEEGGGGRVSWAYGIYGGFTIANGVTIENAIGGAGNDMLTGNVAANFLDGGAGNDRMAGGGGNDVYVVGSRGDLVVETSGEGNDAVYAEASYSLAAGASVELLAARDNSLTAAMDLVGNELENIILGNRGANFLDGGAGADILAGFAGDDTYVIDSTLDRVFENAGEGNDVLYADMTFALGGGGSIETLAARDNSLTTAIDLYGSEFDNNVLGNNGNNFLDGNVGVDVLVGYRGNDLYAVDNADDLVFEDANGGTDTVYASVSYAVGAGTSVEMLAARDNSTTTALNLTGNEIANTILGSNGANVLDGKGGGDILVGYGGADTFAFTTAPGAGNVDTIADFAHGTDRIALDDAVFAAIGGTGALNANAFVTGSAAADGSDRIIYDNNTGQLFYDADGNGAGAAMLFAQLGAGLSLSASDFIMI
jgi:Ca2+-binding RTX toxin-like protein